MAIGKLVERIQAVFKYQCFSVFAFVWIEAGECFSLSILSVINIKDSDEIVQACIERDVLG